MSEMIVIQCDYLDGKCSERFEGFSMTSSIRDRESYLQDEGWFAQGDRHYCPAHVLEGD